MFYSKAKWETTDDVGSIIPTSKALGFDKVRSALLSADELFLTPVLGEDLMRVAEDIYNSDQSSDLEQQFLRLMKQAELNLALWYDFQELQLRVTDQGFQRQTTENFAGAYKYQEDQLRRGFRNKGFNAIDRILDFLEKHQADFPDYLSSPAYIDMSMRVVRSAKEVNDVYFIDQSRLVFMRMVPLLKEVEETLLPGVIGQSLYDAMQQAFETKTAEIGDTTVEELRIRCGQFCIFKAVAQLMRQTGSVTDRGLYFLQTAASGEGNENISPADNERAAYRAANAELSATNYQNALTAFIKNYISDRFSGHEHNALDRDNDHRKTFWA